MKKTTDVVAAMVLLDNAEKVGKQMGQPEEYAKQIMARIAPEALNPARWAVLGDFLMHYKNHGWIGSVRGEC